MSSLDRPLECPTYPRTSSFVRPLASIPSKVALLASVRRDLSIVWLRQCQSRGQGSSTRSAKMLRQCWRCWDFLMFQIQSRPGCDVVRCSAKELRWTGTTAALTKMWCIPSVQDKFPYSPLLTLKLSVEMMITMSPFNTHSIVDSPRSATHFRQGIRSQ